MMRSNGWRMRKGLFRADGPSQVAMRIFAGLEGGLRRNEQLKIAARKGKRILLLPDRTLSEMGFGRIGRAGLVNLGLCAQTGADV